MEAEVEAARRTCTDTPPMQPLARPSRPSRRRRASTRRSGAWYEQGEVHYRRARALADAERFPEALEEAEAAIATHERGGPQGEMSRVGAVRFAALVEGGGLGRFSEAVTRLATASAADTSTRVRPGFP
ncbi:hypothetical protein, partial [Streptomyces gardneri]|uniref:hypothetical protein n=1 Tax=Streptomyces gardneri TaxID=66892 RepID=UPI0036C3857D